MGINKFKSYRSLLCPLLVLFFFACKQNAAHKISKGVKLQRLILHLELNEIDSNYELLPSSLNKIEQVVKSDNSLTDNADRVHHEDLLNNISQIRDNVTLNQIEGLSHQIDNLKFHLEELQDNYGGDKHLFRVWHLETLLHNWMPKSESEYLDQEVQAKMDAIHPELIKDMKVLTLGKIDHELVNWDEEKYTNIQSHKNELVRILDEFILLKKKSVDYNQFKSSLIELQNSLIEYLRLIL